MTFLPSGNWLDNISNVIYAETQQHEHHFDLTVNEIHKITGAGTLDFGGSEFKPATTEKLNPEKQKADDDYGWWKLREGPYKIIFNESLNDLDNKVALISPHPHLREAGVVADTYLITTDKESGIFSINITISEAGCNIKENARVAELRVIGS
ncbi:dCTP deaminase [Gracilimonas sp.]|uniref:dCTP deaminase n=1 Tax=Gracilimonas sp. TaxID=1974203 RepID=UPI0032EC2AC9